MTKNITYYLGAGASANKIPTIKNFRDNLAEFSQYLWDVKSDDTNLYNDSDLKILKNYSANVIDKLKNYSSIDTYAKKLFFKSDMELINLKSLINTFLVYEHRNGIDMRYDSFFAALLKGGGKDKIYFPDELNIISWNYDLQIELSLFNILSSIQEVEKLVPNKIIKLNGSIDFDLMVLNDIISNWEVKKILDRYYLLNILTNLFKSYLLYHHEPHRKSHIRYSWEEFNDRNVKLVLAKEVIKNTNILVIIGYSFPTFNREIDRDIINSNQNFEKIYIQAPENYVQGIRQRFNSIQKLPNAKIELITSVDEFIIPWEY